MDDEGPTHDLGSDVEELGDDTFPEMGEAEDAGTDFSKWGIFAFSIKSGHFREGEDDKEGSNDGGNDNVRLADVSEVGLLEFAKSFWIHSAEGLEGIGGGTAKGTDGGVEVRHAVLVERDGGSIRVIISDRIVISIKSGIDGDLRLIRDEVLYHFGISLFDVVAEFLDEELGREELAGDEHADERAYRVECLGEIESLGGGLGRSHRENVGIGGSFQESKTVSDDVGA